MHKILLITIIWIMTTVCIFSQILPTLTEVELLKGKVKRIESQYYYADTKHTSKTISEYDTLGRKTFTIDFYLKRNPKKEYFSYDSIGNVVLYTYKNNDGLQQYSYEYKYDDKGRIINQLELRDGKFFRSYDSLIYNNDNLPIKYSLKNPYSSEQFFFRYNDESQNEKIRHIEKKQDFNRPIDTIEEIRLYNDYGFLTKKKRNSVTHITWNDIENYPSKHSEEYDYVDYKYDKQGNWTEKKIYLNWEEKGRNFHVRIKRIIEYY